jgi:hypothetical protein
MEGSGSDPMEILSWHVSERTEENHDKRNSA